VVEILEMVRGQKERRRTSFLRRSERVLCEV